MLPAVGSRPLPPPPADSRPRQSAPAAPASSAGSAPARPESEPVERGERFYSGSPEADERNAAMAGRRYGDEKDKRRR